MSIGDFAGELMPSMDFLADFISTGSLILGVVCFFGGFLQFLEYRRNAYLAPLSSVLVLVLPAIIFVSLPFLSLLIGAGFTSPQK